MSTMPPRLARIREEQCKRFGCKHDLDYADPCVACPEGHWPALPEFCGASPEPALPSLGTMARNAAGAAVDAVASGFERRSQEAADLLFVAHCKPCEFFRASDNRCAKCGCFLQFKSRLEEWHCPVGKW